jgi:hypothetical protein
MKSKKTKRIDEGFEPPSKIEKKVKVRPPAPAKKKDKPKK